MMKRGGGMGAGNHPTKKHHKTNPHFFGGEFGNAVWSWWRLPKCMPKYVAKKWYPTKLSMQTKILRNVYIPATPNNQLIYLSEHFSDKSAGCCSIPVMVFQVDHFSCVFYLIKIWRYKKRPNQQLSPCRYLYIRCPTRLGQWVPGPVPSAVAVAQCLASWRVGLTWCTARQQFPSSRIAQGRPKRNL